MSDTQFSTPSKDCISEEKEVVATPEPNKKKHKDKPDISHLIYVRRTWKADLKLSSGRLREYSHKADDINEFLAIIKENFKEGYQILSIIGGG